MSNLTACRVPSKSVRFFAVEKCYSYTESICSSDVEESSMKGEKGTAQLEPALGPVPTARGKCRRVLT